LAGHIRTRTLKSGKKSYQARLDTPTGELVKTFSKRGDAQRWLDDRHAAILRAELISPAAARTTVADLSLAWRESWHGRLAPTTQERYEQTYRLYVEPILGPVRLDALTTRALQVFIDQVAAGQVRNVDRKRFNGQAPAPSTVAKVHATLSSLLGVGIRHDLLARNPAIGVVLPRSTKRKRIIWSSGELQDILDRVPEHHRLAVRLAADTGIRAGELWGAQVGDLDHDRLHVRRALKYVKNTLTYGPTKTYQERTITLPPMLAEDLRLHIQTGRGDSDAPLFTAKEGGLVHHTTFIQRHWKPIQREVFPLHRQDTFHALRHRHASLLLGNGAPVIAVSKRLGHRSVRTTLDIYGHLLDDADGRLTDLWSRL
jgi:integrase